MTFATKKYLSFFKTNGFSNLIFKIPIVHKKNLNISFDNYNMIKFKIQNNNLKSNDIELLQMNEDFSDLYLTKTIKPKFMVLEKLLGLYHELKIPNFNEPKHIANYIKRKLCVTIILNHNYNTLNIYHKRKLIPLLIKYISNEINIIEQLTIKNNIRSKDICEILRIQSNILLKMIKYYNQKYDAFNNQNYDHVLSLIKLNQINIHILACNMDVIDIYDLGKYIKIIKNQDDIGYLSLYKYNPSHDYYDLQNIKNSIKKKIFNHLEDETFIDKNLSLIISHLYQLKNIDISIDSTIPNINILLKKATDEFKFLKECNIIRLGYLISKNYTLNNGFYKELKLQFLKETPYYYSELLKMKFGLTQKITQNQRVSKTIKDIMSKLFLASYAKKGPQFIKNFNLNFGHICILLRSEIENVHDLPSEAYIEMLLKLIKEDITIMIENKQNKIIALEHNLEGFNDLRECFMNEAFLRSYSGNDDFESILELILTNNLLNTHHMNILTLAKSINFLFFISKFEKSTVKIQNALLVNILEKLFKIYNKQMPLHAPSIIQSLLTIQNIISMKKYDDKILDLFKTVFNEIIKGIIKHFANLMKYMTNSKDIIILCLKLVSEIRENALDIEIYDLQQILLIWLNDKLNTWDDQILRQTLKIYLISLNDSNSNIKIIDTIAENIINKFGTTVLVKSIDPELIINFLRFSKSLAQKQIKNPMINEVTYSLMRFFADHFKKISIGDFEIIMVNLKENNLLEASFDDGSNLYTQTIIGETRDYVKQNKNIFSKNFIESFEEIYNLNDENTLNFQSILDKLK